LRNGNADSDREGRFASLANFRGVEQHGARAKSSAPWVL
jgi:hypothetical protein